MSNMNIEINELRRLKHESKSYKEEIYRLTISF